MSIKKRDQHNRWRNVTISFRVSPEEGELLNTYVRLSSLTKQDYLIRRVLHKVLRGKLRAAETAAYFRRYSLPDCACGHQTAHNHYDERRASVTC